MAVFQKITNKLLYYPIIPLLGIYPKELKAGTLTFIVALFTIAKRWKKYKGLSTNKWINKMWYIHTGEHYSVIEKEF